TYEEKLAVSISAIHCSLKISNVMLSNKTFFFFFQAEDGIRDDLVTGVQTCALPISQHFRRPRQTDCLWSGGVQDHPGQCGETPSDRKSVVVGKECRSGWGAGDLKKKRRGLV